MTHHPSTDPKPCRLAVFLVKSTLGVGIARRSEDFLKSFLDLLVNLLVWYTIPIDFSWFVGLSLFPAVVTIVGVAIDTVRVLRTGFSTVFATLALLLREGGAWERHLLQFSTTCLELKLDCEIGTSWRRSPTAENKGRTEEEGPQLGSGARRRCQQSQEPGSRHEMGQPAYLCIRERQCSKTEPLVGLSGMCPGFRPNQPFCAAEDGSG